jgi:hypothetical protein
LKCHCVNSIAGQADPFIFIVGARYIPATVYFPSFWMNPFFLTHHLMVFVESQLCEELNW